VEKRKATGLTLDLTDQVAATESQAGTGLLNPTWVEWLMGFPAGLTDCESPVKGLSLWLQHWRLLLFGRY
ncbi:hypothetical protein LCGC14_3117210, partial [marine sediment metagenome]